MLVQEFLQNSAAHRPDKVALICDQQRLTYADLEVMANRLAQALVENGLQRGERVVIFLNNSVEAVVAIFATLKAGGVFVVVNPTTKAQKLAYILHNCQARVLCSESRQIALTDALLSGRSSLRLHLLCGKQAAPLASAREHCLAFDTVQRDYPATCPPSRNIDLDLACLIYTSGSTGSPKGVMSDHDNVDFATGSIITYLRNVAEDIVINALPLSFDYGLYQLLMVFKFGGTLILERGFTYPAAILKTMAAERVTGFPGVPTMFALLLQMDLNPYDLSSLRYLTNTGAALPPGHITAIQQKFPWACLYSMYGLTETKRTLYLPPDQLAKRPGSVGIAIPGTEVWLEDENGQRLGPGHIGELVVRGRHVMRGYWGEPGLTAQRYRPGPLPGERLCYTGDLFLMDEAGYFYFVGRQDDIIKCKGEKVSPKEIENVLYELPGVIEAAVIGVPDPVMGQAIKAFVVPNGAGLTEAAVLAHCRAHLENLLVPKCVEFRAALPKTTSGKISKVGLS